MSKYKAISHVTMNNSTSSIMEFNNIPSTYTDLHLLFSIRDSRLTQGPGYMHLKFNDNSSSYSSRHLYTTTDSPYSPFSQSRSDDYLSFAINTDLSVADTFCNGSIYIPNYTTSNHKVVASEVVSENTSELHSVRHISSFLWSNTSAITKITLYGDTNFKIYSSATLYGIKKD